MEPLRHTVLRYCDVFRKLGFVLDDPAPAVRRDRPNPFGEKHGVWVGFAPFSAHRGKTYPEEQSRELVRMLSERYGRVFIHGGGGAEQAFAEEMERTYPNVTALYGKVRFAGEMDLIANLDCVVTMDSLVMHLASLVAITFGRFSKDFLLLLLSRAGFSGLRGFVRERFAGRHGVPSLLGLRQQALPLRRLPLPESRYARNGGPAGGRNHWQLAGMSRKRINRLNP